MKKSLFLIIILSGLLFSCSTEVDNYADYKDITIVYGMLETGVDTTFVKITKAFLGPGNALLIAQNPDSSNYPGKLNVTLAGKKNGVDLPLITLDTVTIHTKLAGDSIFYFPNQLLYFTKSTIDAAATYVLKIEKPNETVSSTSKVVQSFVILQPTNRINFASSVPTQIKWNSAVNGRRYEIVLRFNYKELQPGNPDTLDKYMIWNLGMIKSNTSTGGEALEVSYLGDDFYTRLGQELENILNVKRWAGKAEVTISCGADELSTFIDVSEPSNSIVQEVPNYSNIDNGYGIFSSRLNYTRQYPLTVQSELKLVENYDWGFVLNR